jgi:hypothetical protein
VSENRAVAATVENHGDDPSRGLALRAVGRGGDGRRRRLLRLAGLGRLRIRGGGWRRFRRGGRSLGGAGAGQRLAVSLQPSRGLPVFIGLLALATCS